MADTQAATQADDNMEAFDTQGDHIDSQAIQDPWGKLCERDLKLKTLGVRRYNFSPRTSEPNKIHEIFDGEFRVGRDLSCNLVLEPMILPDVIFNRVSKLHFVIKRNLSEIRAPTYITDHSMNGTFLNGLAIGKNKSRILFDNDVISLVNSVYKILTFKYFHRDELPLHFPVEIRSNYFVGREVGSGAAGVVRLVHERLTCGQFAMKTVKRNIMGDRTERLAIRSINNDVNIRREIEIMNVLKHPCIIKTHQTIEKPEYVYMVLEFMQGGDLLHRIMDSNFIDEPTSKLFFYQLCLGVQYLHANGVTHRDLKPDNILLATNTKETLLKISDFGLSKLVHQNSNMRTMCGTPNYVAPEIIKTQGRGCYNSKIDIWSLAVVLFTCLSGTMPFHDNAQSMATEQIINGRYEFASPVWRRVSHTAIKLIKKMLTVMPDERPDIDAVLRHKWLDDQPIIAKCKELMGPDVPEINVTPSANVEVLNDLQQLTVSGSMRVALNDQVVHESDDVPRNFVFTAPLPKRQRID